MTKTNSFYTEEEVLASFPKGRDEVRVMIGRKKVRGEERQYLDIRAWYMDATNTFMPGKGFAKPMSNEEILEISEVLKDYVNNQEG